MSIFNDNNELVLKVESHVHDIMVSSTIYTTQEMYSNKDSYISNQSMRNDILDLDMMKTGPAEFMRCINKYFNIENLTLSRPTDLTNKMKFIDVVSMVDGVEHTILRIYIISPDNVVDSWIDVITI